MKLSIKNIMCDVKVNNDMIYITDTDVNRILNQKQRTKRGKTISRDKLVETDSCIRVNNNMLFSVYTKHIDECYHNTKTLNHFFAKTSL